MKAVLAKVSSQLGGYSTLVVGWTNLKGDEKLGAGVDFTWTVPMELGGSWPTLFYDETETLSSPYLATTAVVSAEHVSGIHVSVDLGRARVAECTPCLTPSSRSSRSTRPSEIRGRRSHKSGVERRPGVEARRWCGLSGAAGILRRGRPLTRSSEAGKETDEPACA